MASLPDAGTGAPAPRTEAEDQIVQRLFSALDACAKSQQIGHVAQDPQFDWGENAEMDLRPDLAFVSFERRAPYRNVPTPHTWHVVPDLVVAVKRSSEPTERIRSCVENYFNSGVRRVWIVDVQGRKIHDHESPSSVRELGPDHEVHGGEVIPGFQAPVRELL